MSEDKKYAILPWDGPSHASEGVPWHLHQWTPVAKRGVFQLLDNKIKRGNDGVWYREGDYINRLTGSDIHVFEKSDMEQIYSLSATEGVTLMEAVKEYVGKDRFSRAWEEDVRSGTPVYADPRYSADNAPKPAKRGPGRPKKVVEEV